MLMDKNSKAQAERQVLMSFSSLRANIRSAAAKPRGDLIRSLVWRAGQHMAIRLRRDQVLHDLQQGGLLEPGPPSLQGLAKRLVAAKGLFHQPQKLAGRQASRQQGPAQLQELPLQEHGVQPEETQPGEGGPGRARQAAAAPVVAEEQARRQPRQLRPPLLDENHIAEKPLVAAGVMLQVRQCVDGHGGDRQGHKDPLQP